MTSRRPAMKLQILAFASLCVGALALAQCGLVSDTKKNESDDGSANAGGSSHSGTGGGSALGSGGHAEVTPPATAAWSFGSGTESVVASPVMDEAGTIYTVVGRRDVSRLDAGLKMDETIRVDSPAMIRSLRVLALEPDGTRKWDTGLDCKSDATVGFEELVSVAVNKEQLFVSACGALFRMDMAGKVQQKTPGVWSYGLAVAADGTALAFTQGEDYTLVAVSPGGDVKWQRQLGTFVGTRRESMYYQTQFGPLTAPVIAGGELLYVPCDTCGYHAGVAQVDWETGNATQVIADESVAVLPGMGFYTYGTLAASPEGGVYYSNRDLYFYDTINQHRLPDTGGAKGVLVGKDGPVHAEGSNSDVHWGEVDVTLEERNGDVAALLEPDIALMTSGKGFNKEGKKVFELENANLREHFVLPLDGHIVYVTESQLLVSKTVKEVRGFEVGAPWPSPAGNAQGNRRVD